MSDTSQPTDQQLAVMAQLLQPAMAFVHPGAVISIAASLLSEDGENPEYDRAICEMVCDLLGVHMDFKEDVDLVLRKIRNDAPSPLGPRGVID